jgi:hypothetical protein
MGLELSKSPEKESLKEKYLLLRGEYVKLLTDKDSLLKWGEPQLEALYVLKVEICQYRVMKFYRWNT